MPEMILDAKKKAIESLLQDRDIETRNLIFKELSSSPQKHAQLIRELQNSPCQDVRQLALDLLAGASSKSQQFSVHRPPDPAQDWADLEQFCWWLCHQEYPCFCPNEGIRILDAWADEVDDVSMGCHSPVERIRRLNQVLIHKKSLAGDREDYYSPENSYLNRVVDRKKGIPISLSLIYIFVGRRVGWDISGLNTPGHFLVCIEDVAFDPFFGGKILDTRGLASRTFLPECEFYDLNSFQAEPLDVAKRVLANLYNSYRRLDDIDRLLRIADLLQSLSEAD